MRCRKALKGHQQSHASCYLLNPETASNLLVTTQQTEHDAMGQHLYTLKRKALPLGI